MIFCVIREVPTQPRFSKGLEWLCVTTGFHSYSTLWKTHTSTGNQLNISGFHEGRTCSYSKTAGKDNDSDFTVVISWPQMCWLHPSGKSPHTGSIHGASSVSLWNVSYFTGEVIGVVGKTRSSLMNVNPCIKFILHCSSIQHKCHTLVTMNIGQNKFWKPPPLFQPCACTQIFLFT